MLVRELVSDRVLVLEVRDDESDFVLVREPVRELVREIVSDPVLLRELVREVVPTPVLVCEELCDVVSCPVLVLELLRELDTVLVRDVACGSVLLCVLLRVEVV